MRKMFIFLTFLLVFHGFVFSTPLFTPTIDGIKEAGWGTTPDATSPSYSNITGTIGTFTSVNPCRDIYITDDPNNLYIGYYYAGDVWNNGGNASARLMFGFITNSSGNSGGTADPWMSSTTFGANNRPDFFLRQWTEAPYDERMEFGGALGLSVETKGVAEFLKWNGSAWVGAGVTIEHFERLTTNATEGFTVYAAKPATWSAVNIHFWGGDAGSTTWPGSAMSDLGNGWWKYTFASGSYTSLVFCDPADPNNKKTVDLTRNTAGWYSNNTWYDYKPNTQNPTNNWGEIAIPLSALGLKTGDTVKIFYYYRPDMSKAGFSDSTPFDPNASVDGNTAATLHSNFSYIIRSDNIAPTIATNTPVHNATNIARVTNFYFRVTDNKVFSSTNINLTIQGNEAIRNGVVQNGNGYYGYIVTNAGNTNYGVYITNLSYSYNQKVNFTITVKDEAGNTTERSVYYTVMPDTTPPTFSAHSPAMGATGVARNENIQYTVNDDEQVLQGTIVTTVNGVVAYTNMSAQTGFAVTAISSGNGYIVTVNPDSDFNFNQTVTITNIAKDKSSNATTNIYTFTITPDNIKPTISAQSPANGATGVLRSANVTFTLNDNIQVVSNKINTRFIIGIVTNLVLVNGAFQSGYSGTIAVNGNGFNVTIDPNTDFNYNQTVGVWANFYDTLNNQDTNTWTFNTIADTAAPTIGGQNPANGASGIDRSANIVFWVDDDASVNINTLNVKLNGVDAIVNNIAQSGYQIISQTPYNNGKTVTLGHPAFNYDQTVSVYVSVADSSGNPLTASYSFTVKQDDVIPYITNIDPTANANNQAIDRIIYLTVADESTVDSSSVVVKINSVLAVSNGQFYNEYNGPLSQMANSNGCLNLAIDRTTDYIYRSNYTVSVSAKDNRANTLVTNYLFTIKPDDILPVFKNHAPSKGASGVQNDADFTVTISDNFAVKEDSLVIRLVTNNVTNMVLSNKVFQAGFSGSVVSNSGESGFNITIDPAENFPLTGITVNILLAATDLEGNPVNDLWTFTIQSGDITKPSISKMNPAIGQERVEPTANIYFETADNQGVVSNKINVWVIFPNQVTNIAIENGVFQSPFNGIGSKIVSNAFNGYDITVDYTAHYQFTNTYGVIALVVDGGNNTNSLSWSFTIREPDTTKPIVGKILPVDGAKDVPVSTSVYFQVSDNYGVMSNQITVWINDTLALTNGLFTDIYNGAGSSMTENSENGFGIMIDPIKDLNYGELVNIKVRAVDTSSNITVTNFTFTLQSEKIAIPRTSIIDPSKGSDKISVKLNRTGYFAVTIYNLRGEVVKTIASQYYNMGDYIEWDGKLNDTGLKVGSGMYYMKITGSDMNMVVKVAVIH